MTGEQRGELLTVVSRSMHVLGAVDSGAMTENKKSTAASWPRRIRYVSLAILLAFGAWVGAHAFAKPAGPSTLAPAIAEPPLPPAEENAFTFLRNKHFPSLQDPDTRRLLLEAEEKPWKDLDAKALQRVYETEKVGEKLTALDEATAMPSVADDCLYDMSNCSTLAVFSAYEYDLLAALYVTVRDPTADEGPGRIASVLRMADQHAATSKSLISEMVAMTALVRGLRLAVGFGKNGYKGAMLVGTLAGLSIRKADAARVIRKESVWAHNVMMAEEKAMKWHQRMLFAGADTASAYDDVVRAWLRTFENGEPPPAPPANPKASPLWWLWNPQGKMMLSVLDSLSLAGIKLNETFKDAQAALDEAKRVVKP